MRIERFTPAISPIRFSYNRKQRMIISDDSNIFVERTNISEMVRQYLVHYIDFKFVISAEILNEKDIEGQIVGCKWKFMGFNFDTFNMRAITLNDEEREKATPIALALLRDYNDGIGVFHQPVLEIDYYGQILKFSEEGELL